MDLADVPRHRPMAFDKMESLIKEMQDPDTGVPVRSQKLFLTYIPAAFMGYDLVEWLMERFNLDETSNVEAINLANLLCQYGYFFPVNDSKNLVLKDDSSLYRFQSPYYWPWQAPRVAGGSSAPTLGPDNVEYAIYLVKRTLRNKQRHGLEDYELEALANLKKNLAAKWDFITMQAEEQVRLAKDRKKGDKIVSDSQERAYWRVARPPPGMPSALEPCPVPVRTKNLKPKKRTAEQITREIEYLKASLDRTRVKTSIALEALLAFSETFAPYDPWLTPPQPSNPWVSDDTLFWQINSPLVEVPSEKRVQRWAISIEELVADPTGLQEFTSFLRKEYSHENIRFWLAVVDLRRSSVKQIPKKLEDICEEFLKPGAPCEINIDGATAEKVAEGVRTGSRYALDHAADHIYSLLLKKDCYPRFIRSDHFQRLLAEGKNVSLKKAKFFNFGGQVKKKPVGAAGPSGSGAGLSRRRGSDRSLSGSAHELAVSAAQPPRAPDPPPHSHSQSNLADISRDPDDDTADVMPWECASRDVYGASGSGSGGGGGARRRQDSAADSGSSSSDISGVVERRRLPQQSTLDGGLRGAPPPLRRLSAVEPRHLAPLASPPHSPHSPRAPPPAPAAPTAPAPPPHPTPTISVSSAPDDGSPEEAASGAHSDDPPSVFASAEATPTHETIGELERSVCGSNVRVTVFECEADVDSSRRDDDAPPHRTLTREPSMTKETSPASCKDTYSEIGDLPESSRSTETSNVTSQPGRTEATTPKESVSSAPVSKGMAVSAAPALGAAAVRHELEAEVEDATSSTSSSAPASSSAALAAAAPADPVTSAAPAAPCAPTVLPAAPAAPAPEPVTHAVLPPAPRPAPLAVCEDIIDDEVDKVPLAPLQTVSDASETAAAKNIAHKDDTSPGGGGGIVRCDSTSGHSDRNRNDVCPWEDE